MAGRYQLTARYLGDERFRPSVTTAPLKVGRPGQRPVAVTVRRGTICTLRLRDGKASCTLRRRQLKPGTHHLVASYRGSRDFAGSTGIATLTIAPSRARRRGGATAVLGAVVGPDQAVLVIPRRLPAWLVHRDVNRVRSSRVYLEPANTPK